MHCNKQLQGSKFLPWQNHWWIYFLHFWGKTTELPWCWLQMSRKTLPISRELKPDWRLDISKIVLGSGMPWGQATRTLTTLNSPKPTHPPAHVASLSLKQSSKRLNVNRAGALLKWAKLFSTSVANIKTTLRVCLKSEFTSEIAWVEEESIIYPP